MAGKRSITSAELRQDCRTMERALQTRRRASDVDIKAWRPGGDQNPGRDAHAWLTYYRWLHRTDARAGAGADGAAPMSATHDAAVVDALRGEPELVLLPSSVDAEGRPMRVTVHPKSLHALLTLAAHDHAINYLNDRVPALRRLQTAPGVELLRRTLEELSYQQRLCCWIVCHEGPGLPYGEEDATRLTLPEWTRTIGPLDLLRIFQAHLAVNAVRLEALASLVDQDAAGESRRPSSWGVFMGAAAVELKTRPETLMRDWSLTATIAAVHSHAESQRAALARDPASPT